MGLHLLKIVRPEHKLVSAKYLNSGQRAICKTNNSRANPSYVGHEVIVSADRIVVLSNGDWWQKDSCAEQFAPVNTSEPSTKKGSELERGQVVLSKNLIYTDHPCLVAGDSIDVLSNGDRWTKRCENDLDFEVLPPGTELTFVVKH